MKNYKQPGDVIELTAPSGGVESGDGVKIGQLFVVAVQDAEAGEKFSGQVTGVVTLPRKEADDAWSEGDLIYWDDSDDEATTTAGTDLLIGCATKSTGAADDEGEVRLNGVARADEPE